MNPALAGAAPTACASVPRAGLRRRRFLQAWPQMACEAGNPRAMRAQQLLPHSTPHDWRDACLLVLAHPLSRRTSQSQGGGESEGSAPFGGSDDSLPVWRMKTAWPAAPSWQTERAEVLSRRESSVNRAVPLCVRCALSSAERPVVAMDMALSLEAYNQGGFK